VPQDQGACIGEDPRCVGAACRLSVEQSQGARGECNHRGGRGDREQVSENPTLAPAPDNRPAPRGPAS